MKKDKMKVVIGLKSEDFMPEIKASLLNMYTLEIVSDSEEAYHAIHDFKPDIVVLDFSLEKIHPIELYEGVELIHSKTHFVICVNDDNYKVATRVWSKRSCDFIFKPFTAKQFVNDINKIVRNLFDMREIETLKMKIKQLEAELKDN